MVGSQDMMKYIPLIINWVPLLPIVANRSWKVITAVGNHTTAKLKKGQKLKTELHFTLKTRKIRKTITKYISLEKKG